MNQRPIFLTDDLERQLVLAAMEEQFRPKPFKALVALIKRITVSVQGVRTKSLSTQTA